MPQLPSGRHVGLSHGRALAMADDYRVDLIMALAVADREENGMLKLMNVVCFEPNDLPDPDTLGKPYLSDLMGSDVATDKCDWSETDKAAFLEWVNSDRMQRGFESARDEIKERFKKAKTPESLLGIMDGD